MLKKIILGATLINLLPLGGMGGYIHAQSTLLHYKSPATYFEEALPIGNGTQGAMVYGGVGEDKISLNDITLWTGEPDSTIYANQNLENLENLDLPEAPKTFLVDEEEAAAKAKLDSIAALDKPKQFTGTSIVIKTVAPVREAVEKSVLDGFEPHFVVMKGHHAEALKALARMFGFKACLYQ